MLAIFKKEIAAFFSSLIGYLVIGGFIVLLGLLLFVFPDSSLLNGSRATLGPFFGLAPEIFMLLIPAITMRTFAEEKQIGSLELLATKPLRDVSLIGGKFLACMVLVLIALLPTLLYYVTIVNLGNPVGNIDAGATAGAYLGLLLLAGIYVAIGLFASTLTENQIVAFLLGAFLCFLFQWGFDYFSRLPLFVAKLDDIVQQMGIAYHYRSISRGLVDSRDIVYFLSVTGLFLFFALLSLERRKW